MKEPSGKWWSEELGLERQVGTGARKDEGRCHSQQATVKTKQLIGKR